MDAVLACLDEISLEGLDGCPIIHLWKCLEQRSPPFILKLDELTKNFLWKGIVETLDVEFHTLKEPLPHIFSNEKDKKYSLDEYNLNEDCEIQLDFTANTLKIINDETKGVRGSCPEYETRQNITGEIRNSPHRCLSSLEQTYERWGDRLVIVASQYERNKALFHPEVDPHCQLSAIGYCVLEHIGKSRFRGRLQSYITKHIKLDPKTSFYYLKTLKASGFIVKQSLMLLIQPGKSFLSNNMRLTRFYTPIAHKYSILGEELSSLLQEQPGQSMTIPQLKKYYGKNRWETFKKVRHYLEKLGYIELVYTPLKGSSRHDQSAETTTTSQKNKYLKPLKERAYVQLVKAFVFAEEADREYEDEKEKESIITSAASPRYVAELSMLKNMYDFIEQQGPCGVDYHEIDNGMMVQQYDRRYMLRILQSSGYIKGVLCYAGKQNVNRYVAKPHVETSIHNTRICKEKEKLRLMKEEATARMASAQTTPDVTPNDTPATSPCPSPAPSTLSTEAQDTDILEKLPEKVKHIKEQPVTYRLLKRKSFIVELLKKHKILDGVATILKAVLEAEEEEGLDNRTDRKILFKILAALIREGLIKKLKTIITVENYSKQAEFYLDSSVDAQDSVVREAIEQCRIKLSGENANLLRQRQIMLRQERKERNAEERLRTKEVRVVEKKAKREEVMVATRLELQSDATLRFRYGFLAKLPRMRLFHEYLWYSTHTTKKKHGEGHAEAGQTDVTRSTSVNRSSEQFPNSTSNGPSTVDVGPNISGPTESKFPTKNLPCDTSGSNEPGTADPTSRISKVKRSEPVKTVQSSGEFDANTYDYGWLDNVTRLPMIDDSRGWFKVSDAFQLMPLSVYCSIVGITVKVDGLEEMYNNPETKHTLMRYLPPVMQRTIHLENRYKECLCDIIANLLCVGLLTPKLPMPSERFLTILHVSEGAIVVDTTNCKSSYIYVEPPDNQPFPSKKFVFNTFTAVQLYWDELKCVCLNTPVGVVRPPNKVTPYRRNWYKFRQCKTPTIFEDNIVSPQGDGRGAAGLDSLLYAHLHRNWSFISGNLVRHINQMAAKGPVRRWE